VFLPIAWAGQQRRQPEGRHLRRLRQVLEDRGPPRVGRLHCAIEIYNEKTRDPLASGGNCGVRALQRQYAAFPWGAT
jgi:hypothetical protein